MGQAARAVDSDAIDSSTNWLHLVSGTRLVELLLLRLHVRGQAAAQAGSTSACASYR